MRTYLKATAMEHDSSGILLGCTSVYLPVTIVEGLKGLDDTDVLQVSYHCSPIST